MKHSNHIRFRVLGASAAVLVAFSAQSASAQVLLGTAKGAEKAARTTAEALPGPKLAGRELSMKASGSAAALSEIAVTALSRHVGRTSHQNALRTAITAYHNYRAANPGQVRKPYLYFVDLGLSNSTARGYVFDMETNTLVDGPFMVAHGRGSGARNGVPTSFSNRGGSKASSLGLYLAQETYGFSGTSGGRSYRSVGLRFKGESGGFNNAARARGIVAHGAPYVTSREAGRSEGCPAMEPQRAQRLLPKIANGGVMFIYSPNDQRWLTSDPWINS